MTKKITGCRECPTLRANSAFACMTNRACPWYGHANRQCVERLTTNVRIRDERSSSASPFYFTSPGTERAL